MSLSNMIAETPLPIEQTIGVVDRKERTRNIYILHTALFSSLLGGLDYSHGAYFYFRATAAWWAIYDNTGFR